MQWVYSELRGLVGERKITRGASCLARGADQIFASILLEYGIPYVAVLACENIRDTFHDAAGRAEFDQLWEKAEDIEIMPYLEASEEAFLAAGRRLVELSDCLFAVWDGGQSSGKGGTANIVAYAQRTRRQVLHLNPYSCHRRRI